MQSPKQYAWPAWFLSTALFCSGCTWTGRSGTTHIVVVGFGLVSYTNHAATSIKDVKALGLLVDQGISLGFSQHQHLLINPTEHTNLLLTIRRTPFSLQLTNWTITPTDQ